MTAHAIVRYEVTDAEAYQRYRALAGPSVKAHGGQVVLKGATSLQLEGPNELANYVVIAFESVETARRWYASAEYEAAIAARTGAGEMAISIVG